MTTLSADQQHTLDAILAWVRSTHKERPFITLGGYAGTGKTTLIAVIRKEIAKINKNEKVGFASYTGKAARVLRSKLSEQKVVLPQDTVSTIHALIYSPMVNDRQ
ncbi:AAA family ATPase, partial [Candidatus Woesebacteria bacterium]|nr:AAA family ATPase [Candidatus Woesebacteria bacterium]